MGADLEGHFLTVDHKSLGLEVWLPDFLGVALRKADIIAVLLSFAGEFAYIHECLLYRGPCAKSSQGGPPILATQSVILMPDA